MNILKWWWGNLDNPLSCESCQTIRNYPVVGNLRRIRFLLSSGRLCENPKSVLRQILIFTDSKAIEDKFIHNPFSGLVVTQLVRKTSTAWWRHIWRKALQNETGKKHSMRQQQSGSYKCFDCRQFLKQRQRRPVMILINGIAFSDITSFFFSFYCFCECYHATFLADNNWASLLSCVLMHAEKRCNADIIDEMIINIVDTAPHLHRNRPRCFLAIFQESLGAISATSNYGASAE